MIDMNKKEETNTSVWEQNAPKKLADVAIAEDYTRLDLEDYVRYPKRCGCVILVGGYGCGKTTIAQVIARERLGDDIAAVELNGATWDNKTFAMLDGTRNWAASNSVVPVVIVNEVDLLKTKQYELREYLDRYKTKMLFIMTTNHLGNVDGGIVDRSDVFTIRGFTPKEATAVAFPLLRKKGVGVQESDLLSLFERRLLSSEQHLSLRQIGRVVDNLVLQSTPPSPPVKVKTTLKVV